jgi:hypothetical protein
LGQVGREEEGVGAERQGDEAMEEKGDSSPTEKESGSGDEQEEA